MKLKLHRVCHSPWHTEAFCSVSVRTYGAFTEKEAVDEANGYVQTLSDCSTPRRTGYERDRHGRTRRLWIPVQMTQFGFECCDKHEDVLLEF